MKKKKICQKKLRKLQYMKKKDASLYYINSLINKNND